jgi:hypothetical protein
MTKTNEKDNVISMLSGFTGDISTGLLVHTRLRPTSELIEDSSTNIKN